MEKERNRQIHQKCIRYSISLTDPRSKDFKLLFAKHANYVPRTSDMTALEEFIEEYDEYKQFSPPPIIVDDVEPDNLLFRPLICEEI
jgi:hypothetical protein